MKEEREGTEERGEGEEERDDSERVEDEGEMRGEEGDSTEGRQGEESEDFAGARRARPGAPAFSDEDEIEMLEFVKANTVLYAKEHVHYIDKIKKDRLWEEIGRRVGRTGQDVKRWFQSQRTRYGKLTGDMKKSGSGKNFQMTE